MAASSEALVAGTTHAEHGADRGMDAALMGMMLFIASEVMFFAGLFAAYFTVRSMHDVWPPQGFGEHIDPFPLPAILTVILVSSSFTMQWAVGRIRSLFKRTNTSNLTCWPWKSVRQWSFRTTILSSTMSFRSLTASASTSDFMKLGPLARSISTAQAFAISSAISTRR